MKMHKQGVGERSEQHSLYVYIYIYAHVSMLFYCLVNHDFRFKVRRLVQSLRVGVSASQCQSVSNCTITIVLLHASLHFLMA